MKVLIFLFISLLAIETFGQNKKQVEALLLSEPIKIDGYLNEEVYGNVLPAKDFVQLQPYNGQPSFQPSEAWFFYDQTAIYVGAMLYDSAPDSIFNFLTSRDDIGMSDYFGVYLDPYDQGQLAFGFFITPAGIQTDIKAVKSDGDYEDGSWDAVWESKTRVTDKGWVVEMRIPYSALRFPEKDVHTWGLNMFRNIRRYNSNNSWSMVDRKVSGFIHQEGELTNIKNIKPPVRLSLSPYASGYSEFKGGEKTNFYFKGGMDVKYGINESFTLDMMLIPDFGQIQSDDHQLNLSPYEIYFDEKRQFFNEGTELFNRAGIFYSRRIGASPKFNTIRDNEIIEERPSETQLVNATKISGRTTKGLGIGFLNAMTLPSYATYYDTSLLETRKVKEQPFTNFNVTVFDKLLKNNGYFSVINTNMSMANNPFRANVTATDFQIRNKKKTYSIRGKGGVSNRGESKYETGFFSVLGIQKDAGNLNYGITHSIFSDKYDPNDMGFLQRNNEMYSQSFISYKIIEPFSIFREWSFRTWQTYRRIYKPSKYYGSEIGGSAYTIFKNNYYIYFNMGTETDRSDNYETRDKSRFFILPQYIWIYTEGHTDNRKPLWFYAEHGRYKTLSNDNYGYWGQYSLISRIGRRLNLQYDFKYKADINERGFVNHINTDSIYFAGCNVYNFENIFEASYALNATMSFRVRARHYWKGVISSKYYFLEGEGTVREENNYNQNHNENYNAFNVDFGFRWIFAPGSELSLAWKNSAEDWRDTYVPSFRENLNQTFSIGQTNTLSLKILYYIDYNKIIR